ncbi:MAG: UpxY family transcription antiterminator [Chitinophagaceae bacterium]|nr:UpxY family transcription antiterminator [Chitinophagaceae bacterium]
MMMTTAKKWLAVYTRPRWEKKVFQLLTDRGFEAYCPLNKVRKKWSDRVKVVEEPLFKSYVFVNTDEEGRSRVRMCNGVVNFVYWLGKPAIIQEKDISTIKRFLNDYENVTTEQLTVMPSQEIEVTGGALMDSKGKVLTVKGKRVEVLLDFMGIKLVAFVDKQNVRIIRNTAQ